MTTLTKTVRRKGTVPVWEIGNRCVVVQLEAGDTLAIREENRRGFYRVTFAELFKMLADLTARRREAFIKRRTSELLKSGERITRRGATAQAKQEWKDRNAKADRDAKNGGAKE